jgi:hypothetical protein
MRPVRSRLVPVAFGVVTLGVVIAATPPRVSIVAAGLTFTQRVTSARAAANPNDQSARALSRTTLVRMSAGAVRMDITDGVTPFTGPGGFMVLRDGPPRLEAVNPEKKQVMIMPASALGGALGALTNNPLIKMKTSNETFDFQDLGAGETIQGYKTRHVRITSGQTIEMRVLISRTKTTSKSTMDAFVSPDLAPDDATIRVWVTSFAGGLRTTNPELMAKLDDYVRGPGRGVVLKATTYMQQTDDKKGTTYDTLVTLVSDIKKGPVDAGLFTYPKDYEVTDMTAGLEATQVAADSANKAGKNTGLTDSLENASKKDDKGSAVKKGLKGLFKKP